MPQQTARSVAARRAAVPASAPGGGATRAALLRWLSDEVDQLQQLESLEARSTRDHDHKIALAEAILAKAEELRATYRGGVSARAPAWVSADGTSAAW